MTEQERKIERMKQKISDLQKEISQYEKEVAEKKMFMDTPFSEMSYEQLMKFYLSDDNSEIFYGSYYTNQNEETKKQNDLIKSKWQSAYAVFQNRRNERDLQVAVVCMRYLNNHKGQVVLKDEMGTQLREEIENLYWTFTDFDCPTDKWGTVDVKNWGSERSWTKRVSLAITRFDDKASRKIQRNKMVIDCR